MSETIFAGGASVLASGESSPQPSPLQGEGVKKPECHYLVRDGFTGKRDYCHRPATHRFWNGARWFTVCARCADLVRQNTYGKKDITKIP